MITCRANTSEFSKTMDEYLKWSKKQPQEIVNAKLYFITLQSMRETKTATKPQIRSSLNEKSKKYSNRTVGEILTYIYLRSKNRFPRKAATLAARVEKFIKRRESHIQFLRSGWIPAMKKLNFWNRRGDISFVKSKAPKPPDGIKQFGVEKGDVIPARQVLNARGTIFNYIGRGKQASKTVRAILQKGLDAGVRQEIRSMREYIKDKFDRQHNIMKRKGQII